MAELQQRKARHGTAQPKINVDDGRAGQGRI